MLVANLHIWNETSSLASSSACSSTNSLASTLTSSRVSILKFVWGYVAIASHKQEYMCILGADQNKFSSNPINTKNYILIVTSNIG